MAPSPKLATATRSVPRNWRASPTPTAMGSPDPTMPVESTRPDGGWEMCIDPPLPALTPVALERISATTGPSGAPLASWSWSPR